MVFFLLTSALIAATLGVLASFLFLARTTAAPVHTLAIYKDQLAELERDLARGTITSAEEQAARREIERRLIAAAKRERRETTPAAHRRLTLAAVILIGLVPAGAGGLYLWFGHPGLTGQSTAAAEAREVLDLIAERPASDDVIARLSEQLQANMNDPEGWVLLGRALYANGRKMDAIPAYETAARLTETQDERIMAEYVAVLSEALDERLAADADDIDAWRRLADLRMTLGDVAGAQDAYEEVLRLDPEDQAARGALGIDAFSRRE